MPPRSDHYQNEQRGFSAGKQRRPVFVRLLRREIIDEFRDAPKNQEQRRKPPDLRATAESRD